MRTIQSKITITYISLSLAVTALLGILLSVELEGSFSSRLDDQLQTETHTVEGLLGDSFARHDSRAQAESILHTLSFTTKSRITLIRDDGFVAYDSWIADSMLHTLENHATRPEVREARERGVGSNKRQSRSTGDGLFYVARMIHSDNDTSAPIPGVAFIRVAISSRDVDDATNEIRLKAIVAGVLVLVIGIIVSRILAKQVAKPIVEIGEIIKKIQAGDLDQKLPVTSKDEIGRLSLLINEMTGKVKSDIEQLKRLERVRSEFLGNVSHELRTPIFSLKGFLETLHEGAINDPAVNVTFVEKAYNHANRLDSLLTDLIEISRIESGDMKMSFRYFDVVGFLHHAVEEAADQAVAKNQRLVLDVPDHEVLALGDKERLRLVLGNILDNAFKYSSGGTVVTIGLTEKENSISISVSDQGPGIGPEHLPRIFERFYRVDKDRSREVGGTGLGLAIVKHIVEAHGSKVEVASEVGRGTTFSFELKR